MSIPNTTIEAMKKISATKASLLSVFEPLSTVLIGVLFLGEMLLDIQIVGVFIVLVLYIYTVFRKTCF